MSVILITDCDHPTVDIERIIFSSAGYTLKVASCRSADDVIRAGDHAVALLSQYAPITEAVLDALPHLRVLGRYGVGLDNIDLDAAARRGLTVVNVPDYCTDEVADHAFGLILMLCRGLSVLHRHARHGTWDFHSAGDLHRTATQQLGLIGLGRIGTAVARRALASGFTVVATDPHPLGLARIPLVPMAELLHKSDVVTIHAPLDPSTRHLLGSRELALMKPSAFLVNTARGALVDQSALARALTSGQLRGAALDVLETEPPLDNDALLRLPNVVVTPHAAFYSEESISELKSRVAQAMVQALDGP
jgi:D-3-phosphoglycerate dehydrogenase